MLHGLFSMNVLILSQYFWPESFRITELTASLAAAGCRVTVLTGQPNYPDGTVFPGYSSISLRREQHERGYSIYRVPIIPRGRATVFRLCANYCSFILSASIFGPWLLRRYKIDVIFVYAPSPLLQAIAGILLKRIKRAHLVVWVQDLWPQSLEVTGFVKSQRILNAVKEIARWIYHRSDLVLTQSRAFVLSVQELSGSTPVEYFPNPGEASFLEPQQSSQSAFRLEPGFNVVFAGNLGTAQALETVLGAAELLRVESDVRFVLVGSGSRSAWLKEEISRRRLTNVLLPGRFAAQEMPGVLAQASALLVSLVRSPAMKQTVPTKIQAYLAAGRPIIASLDGEGAQVVSEAGAGVTCPAEDIVALANAVLTLKSKSASELQCMGEAGRRYYRRYFDADMLAQSLIQRFRNITNRRIPSESGT